VVFFFGSDQARFSFFFFGSDQAKLLKFN
jgi:hypothetical protein